MACYAKGTGSKEGIQFKKSVSYLANKAPLGKKIVKVIITKGDGFYATNYTLYAGTSENPDTVIEGTSNSTSTTYDLSAGNYTYFKIADTSTYAGYLDSIVIKYAE